MFHYFQKTKLMGQFGLQFIFGLGCWLCLQGLAWAGPCEEVAFSNPTDFAEAMTKGLFLRGGTRGTGGTRPEDSARHNEDQNSLFELYKQGSYPYPHKSAGHFLNDVFRILKDHPELSKPALREQILIFPIKGRDSPQSLKSFVRSLTHSAGQIRSNLFQIEANLGYWMKMLDFSSVDTSNLSKQEKKALKQQQKEDFIAYLNTTALNQKNRDFIKDTSQPYRERAIALYKALEEIRQHPSFPPDKGGLKSQQLGFSVAMGGSFIPPASRIEQAMVELVHTVGFGNATWVASLKSKDPAQSYEALRKILNERDILAVDLGFEGHFPEMTKKFNAKIEDIDPQLKQIEKDIQSQPYTTKGTEVLRLRALSLQESPFRSCMGGDCATRDYFEKALDPNFIYFTSTYKDHKSSGAVTVVLGHALNQKGQKVKVAFVDKIQNVPTDHITAMLEGIRLSLKEQDYRLGLPKEVGDHNDLANESLMRSYVAEGILPQLKNSLNAFTPHKHKYPFEKITYSRADEKLDLWEFEGVKPKDIQIKAGEIHKPKIVSSSVTVRSLYEPILSLKDSRKEEDQIKFLDNLIIVSQIKELGLSQEYVEGHLDFIIKTKGFSFKVRKQAFYILIEFALQERKVHVQSILHQASSFSKTEVTSLIGEMSNWKNTIGYRRVFIDKLSEFANLSQIKLVLESPWDRILNKDTILWRALIAHNIEIVQLVLEKGANINTKNEFGETALIWASRFDHEEIARLVLEKGANPHIQDSQGETALMIAEEAGWTDIVQLIQQSKQKPI